jgi:hypothetical protein
LFDFDISACALENSSFLLEIMAERTCGQYCCNARWWLLAL